MKKILLHILHNGNVSHPHTKNKYNAYPDTRAFGFSCIFHIVLKVYNIGDIQLICSA